MKKKALKRTSLINLLIGYLASFLFIILITLNINSDNELKEVVVNQNEEILESELFDGTHNPERTLVVRDGSPVIDRLHGVILDRNEKSVILNEDPTVYTSVVGGKDDFVLNQRGVIIDSVDHDTSKISRDSGHFITDTHVGSRIHRDNYSTSDSDRLHFEKNSENVDLGILDRRLAELDKRRGSLEEHVEKDKLNRHNKAGFREHDDDIDVSNVTLAKDNDEELGEIDLDFGKNSGKGYGVGKGGELYAYNYPSQGVGAGIGSSAIGAGSGAGVGLGAAIGEGILNGEAVPTLGGVGTGASPLEGQDSNAPPSGGVGGLVGGAGAGGAAGLTQGYVTEDLGIGAGTGAGYKGNGGRGYNYEHLPKNGALHIMMHVDGSGSILNTRKQLDIMKDTILKTALLPYYNNDENLYNKRVTIVSSSGERTLRFFTEAAKKDNVLAIAFQDEAQPAYHLPNFNKKPEDHYLDDIGKLKSSLNGYNGVYRGVMFQVDRGKTFAKSFKEFVGNAFQGKGYLESSNLKKYYRDNNFNHIQNKDGIVFSDEYHAKDSGDPKYYLDLIFKASRKIGLDLDIYGAGLTDGKITNN